MNDTNKFESKSITELENEVNRKWETYNEILELIGGATEFTKREIQLTLSYEILGLRLPYGHPSSLTMLINQIEGMTNSSMLYLDTYIETRNDEDLQKTIDSRKRYYEAIEKFKELDDGLENVWFHSNWKMFDGTVLKLD